jgi:hypothetical protein
MKRFTFVAVAMLVAAPAVAQIVPVSHAPAVAQMRADNPALFDSDAAALRWGQAYYGWKLEVDCATVTYLSPEAERTACKVDATPNPSGCSQFNPYSQQDALVACIAEQEKTATAPPPVPLDFALGAVYVKEPYDEQRIIVVGRALGLDGVEVITGQVIEPASQRGTPVAFVNDGGTGAKRWARVW